MHETPRFKLSAAMLARLLGIVLFAGLGGSAEWLLAHYQNAQASSQREQALSRTEAIRARLEGELNAVVYASNALAALWPQHSDASQIHTILSEAYRRSRHVLTFAIATDYHISEVFPQNGAGPAIGYDLRIQTDWPLLKRSINTRSAVLLAAPGTLTYWTPLFTDGQFFGLLATQIDRKALLDAVGLSQNDLRYQYALAVDDGMMVGAPSLLNDPQASISDITIPGGQWRLALKANADDSGLWLNVLRGLAWLLAVVFAAQSAVLLQMRGKLADLALYDRLTGLPARPLFLDRLKQMIRQTKRSRGKFSVLFIGVDDIQQVHGRHGVKAANMMLAGIGNRLLGTIRHCDTVTRWDGGEFLVLLDACPAEQAKLIADSLRHKIELPVSYGGQELRVGAAIGIATYPEDGRSLTALLKIADARKVRDKSLRAE